MTLVFILTPHEYSFVTLVHSFIHLALLLLTSGFNIPKLIAIPVPVSLSRWREFDDESGAEGLLETARPQRVQFPQALQTLEKGEKWGAARAGEELWPTHEVRTMIDCRFSRRHFGMSKIMSNYLLLLLIVIINV